MGDDATVLMLSSDGMGGMCRSPRLWNMSCNTCLHMFAEHKGVILSAAFSSDIAVLLVASDENRGNVRLWSVESGLELHSFVSDDDAGKVTTATLSADGKVVLVTSSTWGSG